MSDFNSVIGHEQVISYLKKSLQNKQISHAYLLSGDKGAGKNLIAQAFAKALQCEAGYGNACNMCRSCLQFDSHNHPDVHVLTHEKENVIKVDDIRQQITGDVIIKPYSSKYKVYIIDGAEKMNAQAQNALLKTLEEPPAYAVLILLTDSPGALLETIRSRCLNLNLKPVDQGKIQKLLVEKYQIPDYQAKLCAAYSQGNPGRAINMALSQDFNDLQDVVVTLMKKVDEMMAYEMAAEIKNLEPYKQRMGEILDLMLVWYRDVLVLKATDDVNQIVYGEDYRFLKKKAQQSSYEGINKIIDEILLTAGRIKSNVNYQTAMEMLLLTIKEN